MYAPELTNPSRQHVVVTRKPPSSTARTGNTSPESVTITPSPGGFGSMVWAWTGGTATSDTTTAARSKNRADLPARATFK